MDFNSPCRCVDRISEGLQTYHQLLKRTSALYWVDRRYYCQHSVLPGMQRAFRRSSRRRISIRLQQQFESDWSWRFLYDVANIRCSEFWLCYSGATCLCERETYLCSWEFGNQSGRPIDTGKLTHFKSSMKFLTGIYSFFLFIGKWSIYWW